MFLAEWITPNFSLVVAILWLLNLLWTCLAELPMILEICFFACSSSSSFISSAASDLSIDFITLSSSYLSGFIAFLGDSSVSMLGILISSCDLIAWLLSDILITFIAEWSLGFISESSGGNCFTSTPPKVSFFSGFSLAWWY